MRRILLFFVLMCFVIPTAAQEAHTLRIPAAGEYLAALPGVLSISAAEDIWMLTPTLKRTITTDWQTRYAGESVDTDAALAALDAILDYPHDYISATYWGGVTVQAILDANQLPLDDNGATDARFGGLSLSAEPHDLDGDGQPEWLIKLERGDHAQFFLIRRTDGDDLRLLEIPAPFEYICYGCKLDTRLAALADLTGDGLPEMALEYTISGMGRVTGEHVILQWRGDGLAVISPPNPAPDSDASVTLNTTSQTNGVEFAYADLDGDGKTEIVITQPYVDSWECRFEDRRVFAWDETAQIFTRVSSDRAFADSPECAVRLGQAAMWAHDYAAAVTHFSAAVAQFPGYLPANEPPASIIYYRQTELKVYSAMRLALAHALTGDLDSAAAIIAETPVYDPFRPPTVDMVRAAQAVDLAAEGAEGLCAALYNVFLARAVGPLGLSWDATQDIPSLVSNPDRLLNPERAGCDLNAVSPERFAEFPLPPVFLGGPFVWDEDTLSGDPREALIKRAEILYHQAQAAESAGDTAAMLAAYVEIAALVPDSPWSRLAALHLE